MFVITAYEPSVTLLGRDGSARTFFSIAAALQQLGIRWITDNVVVGFSCPLPNRHNVCFFASCIHLIFSVT